MVQIQEHRCSSVRQAESGSIGQIRYKGAGKQIVRDKPGHCRWSSFLVRVRSDTGNRIRL
ncbi:unnamed protein product [Staurois parvus]|uniref:Uncharacterized protein n=1 Tax=Staurois parvus TaxID=386267 RepID=A0ABN9EYR1_9NEOB|nr:unnamed protein product [Staurois parvus]